MSEGTKLIVQRGKESWAYIYVALGFALAIEGAVIQMFTPLVFPFNIIVFLSLGAGTVWLFIFNERFQNWLLNAKTRYEKGRPH